ncbi:MAG: tRNA (adenosine(37)-N6)-dimethylallyltransferase MiaA, partial [Candidatus Pacebacteria bacterium]|nr:tRNA (adenosine(37)-N6)-dimethylallyltransferase MiaA [Candidatus Paceibacterota bacterium]
MIKISKKTREQKINVVVVLGPTACGKSDLAVSIAKKFDGEVISADSRQVYRGMDIGTGKITHREMKGVRHHLLDVADPKDRFSAGDYRMLAQKAIDNIASRGKLPIICGGTGFYIDAVLNDGLLSNVQPNPQLRKKLEKKTAAQLLLALKKIDQKRWKTMAASPSESKNARRLIRAIEIAMALKAMKKTGKEGRRDHEQWQAPESTGGKRVQMPSLRHKYIPIFIGVKPSMEELKKRIRTRLLKRIDDGMLAEAR